MIEIKDLTQLEIEIIINGLRKSFPMESVEELVNKLRNQAIPQILAAKAIEEANKNAQSEEAK